MKIILLSGGSGKRLWPLSNNSRAKQYVTVLEGPNGSLESMVQRMWRQLEASELQEQTRFSTCRSQVELLQRQAGANAPLIIEPEQRDTFPAAALAAAYLYSIAGASLSETIIILPVDAYVESDFFAFLKGLPNLLRESGSQIMLIGMKPSSAVEQNYYIIPENEQHSVNNGLFGCRIKSIKEKPFKDQAKSLMKEGALWNSGIYAFQLDFMITMLMERGFPIHYEELYKQYYKLPKVSFESEVMHSKASKSVIKYDGVWRDMGSWLNLSEEIAFQRFGNVEISNECEQAQVINELDIPITIVGLTNVIVAASPDGILVASKDAGNLINDKLQTMNSKPKYEEKRWGHSKIIDNVVLGSGIQVVTKRIFIAAGQNISYQIHFKRSEVWTIVSGEGVLLLDDHFRQVVCGDAVQIPVRARHSLKAITDMELIEVQSGSHVNDEDIIRLGITWDEITTELNLA